MTPEEELAQSLNGFYGQYGQKLAAQAAPEIVQPSAALQGSLNGFYGDLGGQLEQQRQTDARTAQTNAVDARYGTDLSWLDPSFNQSPAFVGQSAGSQVYANPQDVAAQQSVYNQLGSMVGKPMGFESSGRQTDQYNNWGGVAAGQGAPTFMGNGQQQGLVNQIGGLQGPQWAGDGQQQDVYGQIQGIQDPRFESAARQEGVFNQIQGIKNPVFGSDADQRSVMNDLGSIASSGGAQGLNFDDGSRQAEQYGNMKEIIDNGGLTATERAKRQQARMDEEQWIRGQREADQQQFEQRGMAGSGQQVLALGQDRQAAAGRISMSDLQTAADAEQRRLGTIGMASDAAHAMRGDTFNEQSYMASRGDQALTNKGNMANALRQASYQEGMGTTDAELRRAGLSADMANQLRQSQYQESMGTASVQLQRAGLAGDMANSMRDDQYQEQAYQTGYELDKASTQAQIVGQMRGQDYAELSYNDQRALEGMRQQTNLANQLRSDQFNESVAQRNSDYTGLQGQGNLATNMRNASSQEAQFRAESADHFTQLNQSAFNDAEASNKHFMQSSYQQMMNNRQNWDLTTLGIKTGAAQGLVNSDAAQNNAAFGAQVGIAQSDAAAYNDAQAARRNALLGVEGITAGQTLSGQLGKNAAINAAPALAGATADTLISASAGGPTDVGGGAGGGGAKQPISQPGTTWAGAEKFDPNQAGVGTDKGKFAY